MSISPSAPGSTGFRESKIRAMVSPCSRAIKSISLPIFPNPISAILISTQQTPGEPFIEIDSCHELLLTYFFSGRVRIEDRPRSDQQPLPHISQVRCIAAERNDGCFESFDDV